jgi:hypothetical protein
MFLSGVRFITLMVFFSSAIKNFGNSKNYRGKFYSSGCGVDIPGASGSAGGSGWASAAGVDFMTATAGFNFGFGGVGGLMGWRRGISRPFAAKSRTWPW